MDKTILNDLKKHKSQFKKNKDEENLYYLNVMDLLIDSQKLNKKKNIYDYFGNKNGFFHNDDLYNEYMFRVYGDTSKKKLTYAKIEKTCKFCNIRLFYDNNSCKVVCPNCGYCIKRMVFDNSFNPKTHYIKYEKNYKKTDHLSNCLKKRSKIPTYIKNLIEYKFNELSFPMQKIYKNNRKNFLNYPYVIRKILELLNQKKYMDYFPLLKSNKRIRQHDKLWRKLCIEMKWKFIPTL